MIRLYALACTVLLLVVSGPGVSDGNIDDQPSSNKENSAYDQAAPPSSSIPNEPTKKLFLEQDYETKKKNVHQMPHPRRRMQDDNNIGVTTTNNGGLPACRALDLRTCRPKNVSRRQRNLETTRESLHPIRQQSNSESSSSSSFSSINNCKPVIVSRKVNDYIIIYEGVNFLPSIQPSNGELFDLLTVTKKFWFDFFQFTLAEFVDMEIKVIGVQQTLGRNSFGTPDFDRRRLQVPDFGQTFTNGRVAFEEPSPRGRLDDDRRLQSNNEDPYSQFFELSYMGENADFECYLENVRMIPAFRNTQGIIFNAMDLPGTIAPVPAPIPVPPPTPTVAPAMDPTPAPTLAPFWAPFPVPPPAPTPLPGIPWWLLVAIIPPLLQRTPAPTVTPTMSPSQMPSSLPSASPSQMPSPMPSASPSQMPSESHSPSQMPSAMPSQMPSESTSPSQMPSESLSPSQMPSYMPSPKPTYPTSP